MLAPAAPLWFQYWVENQLLRNGEWIHQQQLIPHHHMSLCLCDKLHNEMARFPYQMLIQTTVFLYANHFQLRGIYKGLKIIQFTCYTFWFVWDTAYICCYVRCRQWQECEALFGSMGEQLSDNESFVLNNAVETAGNAGDCVTREWFGEQWVGASRYCWRSFTVVWQGWSRHKHSINDPTMHLVIHIDAWVTNFYLIMRNTRLY